MLSQFPLFFYFFVFIITVPSSFLLRNLVGCSEQQEWLLDKIYNIVKKADDREQ